MVTNENNTQINTFTEGMNMDWSCDSVKSTQYRYALNVRATNIIGDSDNVSIKSGVLSPIYMCDYFLDNANAFYYRNDGFYIYKTVQSGDYTAIIYKNCNSKLNVGLIEEGSHFKYKHVCSIHCEENYDPKNISAILRYEQDNVVKLYIADGIHNIISINVIDREYLDSLCKEYELGDNDSAKQIPADYIQQNNYFPSSKPIIVGKTAGQLKTSQVQYAYRLYKKHGNCSKLSPLTNKIQIINNSRDIEAGNAEDTVTSIGIKIRLENKDEYVKVFDRVQIYRLQYIKAGQNAEVSLIYDGKYVKDYEEKDGVKSEIAKFSFTDDGKTSIQDLSMDEFSNIDGLIIKPEIIEQNQNYLFAGNIKDDTIINIEDSKTVYCENPIREGNKYIFTAYQYNIYDNIVYITNNGLFYKYILNDDYEDLPLWERLYKSSDDTLKDAHMQYMTYSYFNPYCDINHVYDDNGQYIENYKSNANVSTCRTDSVGHVGGDGPITTWNLILCESSQGGINKYKIGYNAKTNKYQTSDSIGRSDENWEKYIKTHGFDTNVADNYSDIFTSSIFRSLKFGEVYRYGVVFYNKHGKRTNVQWIADVRTPYECELELPNVQDNVYALGVEFSFDKTKMQEFVDEFDIVGYEIVRCDKPDEYTRNLSQVATSTLVQQNLVRENSKSPLYPTGLITSQPQKTVFSLISFDKPFPLNMDFAQSNINANDIYLQIYCPEIQIQRKDFLQKLKNNECSFLPVSYVYNGVKQGNMTGGGTQYIETDPAYNANADYKKMMKGEDGLADNTISFSYNRYRLTAITDRGIKCDHISSSYGDFLYLNTHKIDLSMDTKIEKSRDFFYENRCCTLYTMKDSSIKDYNTSIKADKDGVIFPYICNKNETDVSKYQNIDLIDISKLKPTLIKNVIDVKNLNWEDGFSEHKYDGSTLKSAVKKYKSYLSTIGSTQYLNWICSNKYDVPTGTDSQYGWTESENGTKYQWNIHVEFTNTANTNTSRDPAAVGPIGPGGQCFVLSIRPNRFANNYHGLFEKILYTPSGINQIVKEWGTDKQPYGTALACENIGTLLCNIVHTARQFAGITEEGHKLDTYYGFGNYFKYDSSVNSVDIFDGDVYMQKCQYVGMFKAYDFNDDKSSLQSIQTVFNVPMWSKINTRFDYGQNYRNTNNPNLQLEPGTITGITSQDRALNQYNLIYSDNNTSNNMFNVNDGSDQQNKYSQRVFYSQLKTNGESIDNWQIFKAANFIDVNPKYGEITDMLTVDDQLYFWQQYAFGKFSVNERSLVKDENSNTIQLGQGDILQRADYISTQYGMRKYDMCKIAAEGSVYWFDYNNAGIIKYGSSGQYYRQTGCADYTEDTHVKTCMKYSKDLYENIIPTLSYNSDFNELILSPVKDPKTDDEEFLIFNIKYNIASSFGLFADEVKQHNFFSYKNDCFCIYETQKYIRSIILNKFCCKNGEQEYQNPVELEFVVNKSPSNTKVFDNQQIVFAKYYDSPKDNTKDPYEDMHISFETELNSGSFTKTEGQYITDREGNVCFPIPRDWKDGISRLRGKWMIEYFEKENNCENFAISHIITKFRQSYS